MNRRWLLIIFCTQLYAYNFKIVEQAAIDEAACSIQKEIERRYRKRFITTCLVGAGILGGYCFLRKIWPVSPTVDEKKFETKMPDSGKILGEYNSRVAKMPEFGWFSRKYEWFKGGIRYAIFSIPSACAYAIVGTVGSRMLAPVIDATLTFYRSLNWQWFLEDYVKLAPRLNFLKFTAAVLDPHSPLFSIFKDIKINWNEQLSIFHYQEQLHPLSFDELVKLCLIAQKKLSFQKELDETDEILLEHYWNNVVEAITYCLGFMQYRMTFESDEITPLDRSQLRMTQDDIKSSTQRVALQLPLLLENKDKKKSNGLLGVVYEYCNYVQHLCAILDKNTILE